MLRGWMDKFSGFLLIFRQPSVLLAHYQKNTCMELYAIVISEPNVEQIDIKSHLLTIIESER